MAAIRLWAPVHVHCVLLVRAALSYRLPPALSVLTVLLVNGLCQATITVAMLARPIQRPYMLVPLHPLSVLRARLASMALIVPAMLALPILALTVAAVFL